MADTLTQFFQSDELDEAHSLVDSIVLSDVINSRVTTVIENWDNQQAVANLLRYPQLIPHPIRKAALLRGLNEAMTYNTLAAIVGLQGHADWWMKDELTIIIERLQAIIFGALPVIADRASVTLIGYVSEQDIERLIYFLGYPGHIVQHNVLLALVRLIGSEKTHKRIQIAFNNKKVTGAGRDYGIAHLDTISKDEQPILSYIPNLKEFASD